MINEYTIGAAVLVVAFVGWRFYRWAQGRAQTKS